MIRRAITGGLALATMIGMALPAAASPVNFAELPLPSAGRPLVADVDNRVAVGSYLSNAGYRALRWNADLTVTVLDPLPGETGDTLASGINPAGTATGRAGTKPVLWPAFGVPIALTMPAGYKSATAVDIADDNKIIIGTGIEANSPRSHAFRWDNAQAGPIVLAPLPGHAGSRATKVNSAGTVVGGSVPSGTFAQEVAVRWTADGAVEKLPLLPGAQFSAVKAITESGVMVGNMGFPNGSSIDYVAVRWNLDGTITQLESLFAAEGMFSLASGINDHGMIAGESTGESGARRAVLWRPDGTIADLSAVAGHNSGSASAIDELTTIVGISDGKAARWG